MSERPSNLSHFQSYDDQDIKDLTYGQQKQPCQDLLASAPHTYTDHSITQQWVPEED